VDAVCRNISSLGVRRGTWMMGSFLIFLQCVDGFLTSLGVRRFGLEIEGNPFLRYMMAEFGQLEALAVLKFAALLVVITLILISSYLPWVTRALGAVSFVYVFAAILPWTYLLFIHPLA
jgi:uncharacterized membrane protein